MRRRPYSNTAILFAASTVILIAAATATKAGNHGCARCGREQSCQKVCRLVREEKKVNIVCWGCKCEDFCLPGHSDRDCKHCEAVCETDECNQDGVCSKAKPFVWYDWLPGCSKGIATKNKLMKKTVVKTIPSYKWIVEDLCSQCLKQCDGGAPPTGTPIPPPPPVPGAKVVYGRVE